MESLTPAQMVVKIVNEELTALMGGPGGAPGVGKPSSLCRHDVRPAGFG